MSSKLVRVLALAIVVLAAAIGASASSTTDMLTVNLSVYCEEIGYQGCAYGEFYPIAAFGHIDFSYIGLPWTVSVPFFGGGEYDDYYPRYYHLGRGGDVEITGPNGFTLSGFITSGWTIGNADEVSFEWAHVNFWGEWNNGLYGYGSFDIQTWDFSHGEQPYEIGDLQTQIAPEPGSILLLGSSILGLAAVLRRKFMS